MAKKNNGITAKIKGEIYQKSLLDGVTTREISEWLEDEHGIKFSHVSVASLVKNLKASNEAVTKEIIRPTIEASLASNNAQLQAMRDRMENLYAKAEKDDDLGAQLRVAREIRGFLELAYKVIGVKLDKDDPMDKKVSTAELEDYIAQFVPNAPTPMIDMVLSEKE